MKNISVFNLCLLCFSFYEITIIPHDIYIFIKYISLLYLFVLYCRNIKYNFVVMSFCAIYGFLTLLSTIINEMDINSIVASFVFGLQIIDVFLVTIYFVNKYGVQKYCKILCVFFGTLLILTDILMLFINYDFSSPNENYLIGNKFVVSYLHCFFCAILLLMINSKGIIGGKLVQKGKMRINKYILFVLGFLIFSLLISLKVTCTTGAIINACFLLMCFLPKYLMKKISKPSILLLFLLVSNIIFFGTNSILNTDFFQYIVYEVLHKSFTWTGRLHIWEIVFDLIKIQPWLGYGYYNNIVVDYISFGNAQNGVLKIIIDSGILGLLSYLAILTYCFKSANKKNMYYIFPIYIFMYSMFIASLVEINLTHMLLFVSMAIMYSIHIKEERNQLYENSNYIDAKSD